MEKRDAGEVGCPPGPLLWWMDTRSPGSSSVCTGMTLEHTDASGMPKLLRWKRSQHHSETLG